MFTEGDGAAALHEPRDRVQQRRLAGAVGADDPDRLAGRDPQVDVVDGPETAEVDDDGRGGEGLRHRRPPP